MDAPPGLGFRHPLDPVDAALMLELGIGALPLHQAGQFLDAPQFRVADVVQLQLPALLLPVHGVHSVEVRRKKGRLLSPHPRTDLQKDVLSVHRVLGQKHLAEGLLQLVQLRLHLVVLRPGQLAALRVGEQVCKPRQLPLGPLVMMEGLHQRGQLLLLPVQGRHQVRVLIGLRLGQLGLQFLQPKGGLVQLFPHYDPCSRASCSAFFWACSSASRR